MSYRRQYHSRIAVHYSGSVRYSYPASQSGGSGSAHYSGTTYEDVTVNIDVDTHPFDRSIDNCNNSLNLLTGAVTATEAAQVAAVYQNSKKIANTIVDGFFGYIRSEISQQIMELLQKIDAQLLHLAELAKRCNAKKNQIESDYHRISGRYIKIFNDLDHELENRIFELNKPAFTFKNKFDRHPGYSTGNDLITTVTVSASEGGQLQSKISASVAKKRAADAIQQANVFLRKQKILQSAVNNSMLSENSSAVYFTPVCLAELKEKDTTGKKIYLSGFLPEIEDNLLENLKTCEWSPLLKTHKNKITQYFNIEVNDTYIEDNSQHGQRIKNMINTIFNLDSTLSI